MYLIDFIDFNASEIRYFFSLYACKKKKLYSINERPQYLFEICIMTVMGFLENCP